MGEVWYYAKVLVIVMAFHFFWMLVRLPLYRSFFSDYLDGNIPIRRKMFVFLRDTLIIYVVVLIIFWVKGRPDI